MDANNQEYQDRIDLELRVFSSTEISRFGLRKTGPGLLILIVIVAIVGGYIYWRKRKR